jgi:hypothetical protein
MKNSTSLNHFLENHSVEDLGANKNIIINFWSYIDTLSLEEWLSIGIKLDNITPAYKRSLKPMAENITVFAHALQLSTWICQFEKSVGHIGGSVAIYAAYELIAAEKILESGRSLAVLPLFVNP